MTRGSGRHGDVLLIGSIGLADAGAVFRTLAETLGTRAPRYPDGETGARADWIGWQRALFETHPMFRPDRDGDRREGFADAGPTGFFALADGAEPAILSLPALGYADAALAAFAVFSDLKEAGVVPRSTRFQVSLPTPLALVSGFLRRTDRAAAEPAFERTVAGELKKIAAAIPAHELAVQWDVCYEMIGLTGAYPLHLDDPLAGSVERLVRLCGLVPEGVELGLHLCCGEPGPDRIRPPADTRRATEMANAVLAAAPRPVDWIHLPVPRPRDDAAYFAALAGLRRPAETRLYLGLLHIEDGIDGAARRIAAAETVVPEFGLAAICGLGRMEEAEVSAALALHRAAADL